MRDSLEAFEASDAASGCHLKAMAVVRCQSSLLAREISIGFVEDANHLGCLALDDWKSKNLLLRVVQTLTEPGASKLTKVFLATRTADAVTISTDLGQRRSLVDTRTLERTYVDGDTIKMELVLTTARGDTVRITRYLVRSALPAPAPVAAAVAPPG